MLIDLRRRATAGLIAGAVILAQAVMPVQQAFATTGEGQNLDGADVASINAETVDSEASTNENISPEIAAETPESATSGILSETQNQNDVLSQSQNDVQKLSELTAGRELPFPDEPMQVEVCGGNTNDEILMVPYAESAAVTIVDTGWEVTTDETGITESVRTITYTPVNVADYFTNNYVAEFMFVDNGTDCDAQLPATSLTFQKVDENGNLLPGATFGGESCTRIGNDPDWTCNALQDYAWFRDGLRLYGTTGSNFASNIELEEPIATTCADSTHIVRIGEMSAPDGYAYESGWAAYCLTTSGWLPFSGESEGTIDHWSVEKNENGVSVVSLTNVKPTATVEWLNCRAVEVTWQPASDVNIRIIWKDANGKWIGYTDSGSTSGKWAKYDMPDNVASVEYILSNKEVQYIPENINNGLYMLEDSVRELTRQTVERTKSCEQEGYWSQCDSFWVKTANYPKNYKVKIYWEKDGFAQNTTVGADVTNAQGWWSGLGRSDVESFRYEVVNDKGLVVYSSVDIAKDAACSTPVVPVDPTDPVGPTDPITPVTPGRGSVSDSTADTDASTEETAVVESLTTTLPTELPQTGPSESWRGLLVALTAALATYGAVYFAQPKRERQ